MNFLALLSIILNYKPYQVHKSAILQNQNREKLTAQYGAFYS